jgi:hypothetical protein
MAAINPNAMSASVRYDYAISFAAPERSLARELHRLLNARGCRVFFDEAFEHEMLGTNGADYLNDVFIHQAASCVTLVSGSYTKRVWTELERLAAQARELSDPGYVIPVLVDGIRPSWLLPTKVFFDLTARTLEELAEVLVRRMHARGFGPFRHKRTLGQLFDTLSAPIAIDGVGSGYVTWCVKSQPQPPQVLQIVREPDSNDWQSRSLGIRVRETRLLIDGDSAVVIPDVARDPIERIDIKSGSVCGRLILPRNEPYEMITDVARDDDYLYIGVCGGDVWKVDTALGYAERLSPPTAPVDYASVAITSSGIATSHGEQTVTVRSSEGKLISDFELNHAVSTLVGLPSLGLIACGGALELSMINEESGEVSDEYRLPAQGAWDMAVTNDGMLAFISGLGFGKNVLVLYDGERKREIACLESGHDSAWSHLALQPDGSSLAVMAGEKFVIFDTR